MTDQESCPTPPIGGASAQTDLNAPTAADTAAFVQVHMDQLQDLCQWGLSGSIVTGLLMQFFRNHFSTPTTIMAPTLKTYLWSSANNGVTSGLRIVNFTEFDANSGQQPSIVVKRGLQNSARKMMGDLNHSTLAQRDAGFNNYVRFIQGSHTLFVTGTTDGEAEDLGDEVFDSLTYMAPTFVTNLPFHDFEVVSKGELGVMDTLGNLLGIPIVVNYTYEYGWLVQPIAPRIKTFGLLTK